MTERLPPIQHCLPTPMHVDVDDRYSFSISCSIPIDEFWGCILRRGMGAAGIVSESRGNLGEVLLLDVPPGEYDYQIFGYKNGQIVAGLYGSAADLLDGSELHLIPGQLETDSQA